MPLPAPDPTVLHPIAGQQRVVFLRPLVQSPNIEIGEYTYYDSFGDPLGCPTSRRCSAATPASGSSTWAAAAACSPGALA